MDRGADLGHVDGTPPCRHVLVGAQQSGVNVLGTLQSVGNAVPFLREEGLVGNLAGAGLFFALAVILARYARRPLH